jgi:hypothetical protein
MAGHNRTHKQSSSPPKNQGSRARSKVRSQAFAELVKIAERQGAPRPLGITTNQALQECLDRAVSLWRFADQQLDALTITSADADPDAPFEGFFEELPGAGGSVRVVPNRWYTLALDARRDVERLAGMMTQLGIAERHVRVEEARAVLVIAAIKDAAIEVGLTNDQVRNLGAALRSKLSGEGSSQPVAAAPGTPNQAQNPSTSRQVSTLGPGH